MLSQDVLMMFLLKEIHDFPLSDHSDVQHTLSLTR